HPSTTTTTLTPTTETTTHPSTTDTTLTTTTETTTHPSTTATTLTTTTKTTTHPSTTTTTLTPTTETTTHPSTTDTTLTTTTETCGHGSTCQPRADYTFVCLCLPGEFYNDMSKSCEKAKVFPGHLNLPELSYNVNMSIKSSKQFLETSQKIVAVACDKKTMECHPEDGSFQCACLEAYAKANFSSRMCIACPSGQQAVNYKCEDCYFGYSGFNCKDSWKLTVVVIGSIFGGFLLIAMILLPLMARRSLKKRSQKKENVDIGKPHVTHSLPEPTFVNSLAKNQGAGIPKIPRATMKSNLDRNGHLEMTPTNSWQNLVPIGKKPQLYEDEDYVVPIAQTRPQDNINARTPPSNPYAQSRPQIKPSQGWTNPHYADDDGRRYNY
ncbi:mucin-13-like, partial [Brachionichthys hirsutus]|uniref:mucin-13-like n=1 Tax=Brachionichthys hirsutus TaxID=412623 RepID=UPI00360519B8